MKEQEKVVEELNKIKENIKNSQKTIDNLNSRLSLSLSLSYETKTKKLGEICKVRAGRTPLTELKKNWCYHSENCDCID